MVEAEVEKEEKSALTTFIVPHNFVALYNCSLFLPIYNCSKCSFFVEFVDEILGERIIVI